MVSKTNKTAYFPKTNRSIGSLGTRAHIGMLDALAIYLNDLHDIYIYMYIYMVYKRCISYV